MTTPYRVARERDRVGPYVLVKAIGAGGSARVDLARIERAYGFQRHVVIKRPLEHLRSDPRAAESIRLEARLGARLRHPNLVAVLDAGVHDGYDYIVLDYVNGGSLRSLMETDEGARVRDVPLEVALAIVRDVARGVHEAHELCDHDGAPLGLVHRDVSPGNVLIGLDGAVQLADFGIAKETRVATLSGSMHGTVTYMAPEQCRGHAFDRRADVFSIGVILYELVTGHRLFWADNDVASLHRVLAGTVTRPRTLRGTISPALEDIIMSALAPEQSARMPTAGALADALEHYGTANGHILASRCIARWAHDVLGPRDAAWVGDQTVIDVPPVSPGAIALDPEPVGSLVPIIEAAPAVDEIVLPTFGPTDATVIEDRPPSPIVVSITSPARRTRALVLIVAGAALAAGIAFVVARGGETPSKSPPAAAPTPAPIAVPVTEPEAEPEIDAEPEIEIDPAPAGQPPRKRRKRAKQPAQGSGSAVTKGNPNVEWNPGMLLPTDEKR